jgi:CBS-domain-containing membrane protein
MRVEQLMSRPVWTCRREDTLEDAVRLMEGHGCGCVVVVDGESHPVAVVTDRDAVLAALRARRPLQEIALNEAMSSYVVTCQRSDQVSQAEGAMRGWRVRRLPVVDEAGHIAGLISLDDLAWRAARDRELFARQLSADEVGLTLALAARPHVEAVGQEAR